jgi:hypothetical protein
MRAFISYHRSDLPIADEVRAHLAALAHADEGESPAHSGGQGQVRGGAAEDPTG